MIIKQRAFFAVGAFVLLMSLAGCGGCGPLSVREQNDQCPAERARTAATTKDFERFLQQDAADRARRNN